MSALVAEFADYVQEVCEKRASSTAAESSQRKRTLPQITQADPTPAHRVATLEHQLASVNHIVQQQHSTTNPTTATITTITYIIAAASITVTVTWFHPSFSYTITD